jgi:glycosyltransferase involved in cell wall biosynthesis
VVAAGRRALLLTPDVGYLDRRIAQEAATLADAGWQVDIWSAIDPDLRYEAALPPSVRLVRPPRGGAPAGRLVPLVRRTKRVLVDRVPPVARLLESVQYRLVDRAGLIASDNLPRMLESGPYDLVFAHDVPVLPLALDLKAAWDARVICDLHEAFSEQDEFLVSREARRYWRRLERTLLPQVHGLIAVNPGILEWAGLVAHPTAPSIVLQNAVPHVSRDALVGPDVRSLYSIPADRRILLFAGTLLPSKNLVVLVDALRQGGLDGWDLVFLGSGPIAGAIAERARRVGLQNRVHIGLRVAQDELIGACASADLGLLPYEDIGFNHRVATPNKLYEYAQARLPIAASDLPQIAPILRRLGNGGVMSFKTPESTADGLRRVVDGLLPTLRADLSVLERAAEALSWEQEAPALVGLVDEVMSARARGVA